MGHPRTKVIKIALFDRARVVPISKSIAIKTRVPELCRMALFV